MGKGRGKERTSFKSNSASNNINGKSHGSTQKKHGHQSKHHSLNAKESNSGSGGSEWSKSVLKSITTTQTQNHTQARRKIEFQLAIKSSTSFPSSGNKSSSSISSKPSSGSEQRTSSQSASSNNQAQLQSRKSLLNENAGLFNPTTG